MEKVPVLVYVTRQGEVHVAAPPHADVRVVDARDPCAGVVRLPAGVGFEELARDVGLDDEIPVVFRGGTAVPGKDRT